MKKIANICNQFCQDAGIKIFFTSFKINKYFSHKDETPYFLKSLLAFKFIFARFNSCYIGKTCLHFKVRINEHLEKDRESNFYKHLHNNEEHFSSFRSG